MVCDGKLYRTECNQNFESTRDCLRKVQMDSPGACTEFGE